jgi:hypothetical protein
VSEEQERQAGDKPDLGDVVMPRPNKDETAGLKPHEQADLRAPHAAGRGTHAERDATSAKSKAHDPLAARPHKYRPGSARHDKPHPGGK